MDDSLHVACGDRLTFRHIDLAAQLNTGFPCPCNNSACGFQLRIGYYPPDRGRLVSSQMGVVLGECSSLNGWLYSHDCGKKLEEVQAAENIDIFPNQVPRDD